MSRRSDSSPEVRLTVNGATFLLSTIVPFGAWGKLRHSTRLNGSWAASWSIPNTTTWRHPALVYGARVEIVLGPIVIWSGLLEEPDWDSGQFVAIGACREAETTFGLDSLGNASTKPNEVIDAAIAAGDLTWIRIGDFGATAVGDPSPTAGLVTLTSILDTWAKKNGSRWYVNELRQLVIAPLDENTPKWLIVPGSGVLGSASEQRVDRIYARYIDSTTGRRTTIVYPSTGPARVKKPADFTKDGAMTAAAAQTMAQSLWNENNAGRSGFTNGWTLTRGQITTIGGAVADGALVKAGDPAAGLGLADTRGLAQNTLVVLGDTEYDWEDDELQANPNGLVDRDTDSVLEQVGNLAVSALARSSATVGALDNLGYSSSSPVNGGNIALGINSGDVEIAKWTVPSIPAGARRAYINAIVNARCPAGNQAVLYRLWWSGNGGAVWVEVAFAYVHNHSDATQTLGAALSGFVDFPAGVAANQLQFRLLAATGGGAGNTNFGMINMHATFFG